MAPKTTAVGSAAARGSSRGVARAAAPKATSKAGAPKATPKAKAPAAPAAVVAEPPPLENLWGLDVPEAEKLLRGLNVGDLSALADSLHPAAQLPARYALEFVGDKDFSWENAQTSLRNGETLITEMLDMEGGNFITKASLERYEKLGELDPKALGASGTKAGLVLALYLDACIRSAKTRLGLDAPPMPAAPEPDEKPPSWPVTLPFTEIPQCIHEANKWGKTALLVCCGHALKVDTFFNYRSVTTIDAKWLLSECAVKKTMTVEDARAKLRERVVSAMKFGQPLLLAMSNSAVDIKGTYCVEGLFSEDIFKNELFHQEVAYKKLIRESDLADWPGAFPGRKKAECFSLVTTDFDLDTAKEHLPAVLPHFHDMAVYVVDPASFPENGS